jgi:hypothetical protein
MLKATEKAMRLDRLAIATVALLALMLLSAAAGAG